MASVGWFSGTAGLSGILQAWSILVSDLEYSLVVYMPKTSTFQPTISILGASLATLECIKMHVSNTPSF
jgi:hypothetical protein